MVRVTGLVVRLDKHPTGKTKCPTRFCDFEVGDRNRVMCVVHIAHARRGNPAQLLSAQSGDHARAALASRKSPISCAVKVPTPQRINVFINDIRVNLLLESVECFEGIALSKGAVNKHGSGSCQYSMVCGGIQGN